MTDTFRGDDVIIGTGPHLTRKVTIAAGANLVRGAVLGIITSGGKYTLSLAAAANGSQVPKAILAVDAAAASADVVAAVYYSGTFNGDKLTYGTGHTAATVDAAFASANAPMAVQSPV